MAQPPPCYGIPVPDANCPLRCVKPHYRCAKGEGEYGGQRGVAYFRKPDGTGYYQPGFIGRDAGQARATQARATLRDLRPDLFGDVENLSWSRFMSSTSSIVGTDLSAAADAVFGN